MEFPNFRPLNGLEELSFCLGRHKPFPESVVHLKRLHFLKIDSTGDENGLDHPIMPFAETLSKMSDVEDFFIVCCSFLETARFIF